MTLVLEAVDRFAQISKTAKNREDFHQLASLYHDARHAAHQMGHEKAKALGQHQVAARHALKMKWHKQQSDLHYGHAEKLAKRKTTRIGGLRVFAGRNEDFHDDDIPSLRHNSSKSGRISSASNAVPGGDVEPAR